MFPWVVVGSHIYISLFRYVVLLKDIKLSYYVRSTDGYCTRVYILWKRSINDEMRFMICSHVTVADCCMHNAYALHIYLARRLFMRLLLQKPLKWHVYYDNGINCHVCIAMREKTVRRIKVLLEKQTSISTGMAAYYFISCIMDFTRLPVRNFF